MEPMPNRRSTFFYIVCSLVAAIALFKLFAYRSSEPWIFGLYSLPYFIVLVVAIGGALFVVTIFYRFKLKAFYIIFSLVLFFAVSILAIELSGQIYAFFNPAYRVLAFIPDRDVGWKLAPNLHFTWGGQYWYAREFSVPIETNAHGFRDIQRTVAKPKTVTRVALLGDSMVEAFQVPFAKTAGRVLEQKLNALEPPATTKARKKYEVLNFGVSNYGIGQYLLSWEQYAAKFTPDYVFILVGEIQMERTVRKYEPSAFSTIRQQLWVRPTFRLEDGELVRRPARDFEEFIKVQNELITNEFGEDRTARKAHGLFIASLLRISLWRELRQIRKRWLDARKDSADADATSFQPVDQSIVDVNLRVIEELGYQVKKGGGQFVVIDTSGYFRHLKWKNLTTTLERFCAKKGFGWIPLGNELLQAEKNGVVTRWRYDQHFNETGNKIFAEAVYRWIINRRGSSRNH